MAVIKLEADQEKALQTAVETVEQNPKVTVKTRVGNTEVRAFVNKKLRITILHHITNLQTPIEPNQ